MARSASDSFGIAEAQIVALFMESVVYGACDITPSRPCAGLTEWTPPSIQSRHLPRHLLPLHARVALHRRPNDAQASEGHQLAYGRGSFLDGPLRDTRWCVCYSEPVWQLADA